MTQAEAAFVLLLAIPLVWALMWWGWRRRGRSQADVPAPAAAPADPGEPLLGPREAVYVSTTTAGDWLDRVVAHGLGRRSGCDVAVFGRGLSVAREGADVLWVPRADLTGVRRQRGLAGKYAFGREGLVVLTWRLGGRAVDTGLRVRHDDDGDALVAAVTGLLAPAAGAPPSRPAGSATGSDTGLTTERRVETDAAAGTDPEIDTETEIDTAAGAPGRAPSTNQEDEQ